jgi:hypothetical protein
MLTNVNYFLNLAIENHSPRDESGNVVQFFWISQQPKRSYM